MTSMSFEVERPIAEFITFAQLLCIQIYLVLYNPFHPIIDEQDYIFVINCRKVIISLHNFNFAYTLMY